MTTDGFGYWPSPLSAQEAAAGRTNLAELASDATALHWLESRPEEGGRVVFIRAAEGTAREFSPAGVSIRSRVHEYGGGASCLVAGHGPGAMAYVELNEQRVWLAAPSAAPARSARRLERVNAGPTEG